MLAFCGDGECDEGLKTCSTCGMDCTNCGYKPCKSNCNNHGTCNDGVFSCNSGFGGAACEISSCMSPFLLSFMSIILINCFVLDTPVVVVVNNTSPSAVIVMDDQDKNAITNNVEFSVSFYDKGEVTANGYIFHLSILLFSSLFNNKNI